jgi:hypothetical protein
VCHRRNKAIAAPGDRLDTAPVRSPDIEHPAKCRNLRGQVAVLDDHFRPYGGHDLVLRDEIAVPLYQQGEQTERARADGDGCQNAAFLRSKQTAGSLVEAKAFEQKNFLRGGSLHAAVPPILPRILRL